MYDDEPTIPGEISCPEKFNVTSPLPTFFLFLKSSIAHRCFIAKPLLHGKMFRRVAIDGQSMSVSGILPTPSIINKKKDAQVAKYQKTRRTPKVVDERRREQLHVPSALYSRRHPQFHLSEVVISISGVKFPSRVADVGFLLLLCAAQPFSPDCTNA